MELDLNKKDTIPSINTENIKQQEKEYKLIGRTRNKPGQTLFSFNKITGELKPAELKEKCYMTKFGVAYKKETNVEPNCFYFFALNERNARRKLRL